LEEMMKALIYNQTTLMQSTDKFIQSTEKFMQRTDQAIQSNNRDIQELKSYTTQAMSRLEGQIGHLVTELNRIEEEELQSQLMIERDYMSDEDDFKIFYHEHAQVTTTLDEDEVMDNEDEQVEHNE
jgi:hypothetical protein